jgi:hypothetical protein
MPVANYVMYIFHPMKVTAFLPVICLYFHGFRGCLYSSIRAAGRQIQPPPIWL